MSSLLFNPSADGSSSVQHHLPSLGGRAYRCKCGCPVFFRNSECLACGTPLGYESALARLLPLMPNPLHDPTSEALPNTWMLWQSELTTQPLPAQIYTRCTNLQTPAACNWLVPLQPVQAVNAVADESRPAQLLCQACRLNRTIPDLNDDLHPDNGLLWGRIELAKRRLVSALLALGLPVDSLTEDPQNGIAFDLLRSPDNGPPVMTGHKSGLITLNLQEADDAVREAVRSAMREPYRTLLGHFRHEIGHYYWDRLVHGTPWMDGFHRLFGDETQDYAACLQKNYLQGPPAQWWLHYVSAYASTHPWEDWAECWAHYLHMRDTIDTALSLGLATDSAYLEVTPFTIDALYQPDHPQAQHFLDFLNDWTRLTTLLNEMSRSMGQPDFYPFVLPREVVAKLHFIHLLVSSASWLPDDAGEGYVAQQELDQQIDAQVQTQSQNQSQSQSQSQSQMPDMPAQGSF